MDLKVSSVNFNGKREILYGLNKASRMAQTIEFGRVAYKGGRVNDYLVFNASMRAYLDMVTKDDLFFNSTRTLSQKDLQPIKDNLQEFKTQHGTIRPFGVFKDALEDVIKKERKNSEKKVTAAQELLVLLA